MSAEVKYLAKKPDGQIVHEWPARIDKNFVSSIGASALSAAPLPMIAVDAATNDDWAVEPKVYGDCGHLRTAIWILDQSAYDDAKKIAVSLLNDGRADIQNVDMSKLMISVGRRHEVTGKHPHLIGRIDRMRLDVQNAFVEFHREFGVAALAECTSEQMQKWVAQSTELKIDDVHANFTAGQVEFTYTFLEQTHGLVMTHICVQEDEALKNHSFSLWQTSNTAVEWLDKLEESETAKEGANLAL